MLIPTRTHSGNTRDHPQSHRTTFHSIWQNKSKHQTKGHGRRPGPQSTNHEINPSDKITHPGTTKISRFDSSPTSDYPFAMFSAGWPRGSSRIAAAQTHSVSDKELLCCRTQTLERRMCNLCKASGRWRGRQITNRDRWRCAQRIPRQSHPNGTEATTTSSRQC